jgi:hypothetical protein
MEVDLRYPIGRLQRRETLTPEERVASMDTMAQAPKQLAAAVAGLSAAQLDTPYRPAGWTVRQVVHHLADSHMNAFIRSKLTICENAPTIKTYDQAVWAETADAKTAPVEPSVALFTNLHQRWVLLLRSLTPEDWARKMNHPERGLVSMDDNLSVYQWHGRHHIAQITSLREREGWK